MSGRASKRKGYAGERELVLKHQAAGIPCKRMPLSGAMEGFKGDLKVVDRLIAEVKWRKGGAGFITIERWLGENDLLFLRRDRAELLVVMPWGVYQNLMNHYVFMENCHLARGTKDD